MSIINPFSEVVILPPQDNVTTLVELDLTSTNSGSIYPIIGPCQVTEWGVIVSTVFVAFTVKPIIALQRLPLLAGSPVTIQSLTLAASNTKLRQYTTNPDVVASGGPGTVTVGPSLGGHTSAAATDAALGVVGTVILGDTKSLPSAVLSPGDLLKVIVTTAGTVGSGKVIAFVRLEPVAERYTTAFVQYDTIP